MPADERIVAVFATLRDEAPATPEDVTSVIKSTESTARVRTGNEP